MAGKMAGVAGLDRRQVENIKSAALLFEAGDLRSNLPLFEEISDFVEAERKLAKTPFGDRETVLLQTTTSLLKEVEPILSSYYQHYVQDADNLDKNLSEIPVGSSILALADIYDRIESNAPPFHDLEEYSTIKNILSLAGRTFNEGAVNALQIVVSS
jgi:response regulator RpfG family c-di-GMP phosphodiesterase